MANSNPQLLDRLTPAFQGAIWIGGGALDITVSGFSELNYLFDGLLSQAVYQYSPEQKKIPLSFFTKSFGENFFLYYFIKEVNFPIFLPMSPTENRNKILIINSNPAHTIIQTELLKKHLPSFQFELLELP